MSIQIGAQNNTIHDIINIVHHKISVQLCQDKEYRQKLLNNVEFLRQTMKKQIPIYGTTTGFGASCNQYISWEKSEQLQFNLIQYHLCGTGEFFKPEQVIAIMVARVVSLSKGYSGIRCELLETLIEMINAKITPQIPVEGSVGASGDLTPLAYIAAALQGQGQVIYKNEVVPAKKALEKCNIKPICFGAKEALAIMNGTSVMTGVAALACADIERLSKTMEILTAIVVQVLKGKSQAFDERVHRIKPFLGQQQAAAAILSFLEESKLLSDYEGQSAKYISQKNIKNGLLRLPFKVQDVYSLRCAPHVIGVVKDTLQWARTWVETELNSVNDNPLVFDEDQKILFGGNFYGGYISQAADSLKIAVANLADLADRQLALIVDDKFSNGLPANLVMPNGGNEGLNHGFKGLQITSSALTAEALKNATPASIFSRVTESCNQDKVSMGTIAARDLVRIVELTTRVLAILSLAAVQAIDLCGGKEQISPNIVKFYNDIRSISAPLHKDRPMDKDIQDVAHYLLKNA